MDITERPRHGRGLDAPCADLLALGPGREASVGFGPRGLIRKNREREVGEESGGARLASVEWNLHFFIKSKKMFNALTFRRKTATPIKGMPLGYQARIAPTVSV